MTTHSYIARQLIGILFLLFFISESINGQELQNFDIRIKVHPSALISIPRPTIQAGIELKYKKIGVDLSYGQQWAFLLSSDPDTVRVKNFGNRYRVDLKYYLKRLKSDTVSFPFISVGYCKVYSRQNFTTNWFSGDKYDPSLAFINNIHVFSANLGICNYYERFVFEGIVGTGIRLRTLQSVDAKDRIIEEVKIILPHLSIGVRIGYIINI